MKLNIGGGLKRYEGFKNVDLDSSTNPDYCFNIETDKWTIDDNTVDEIKAHHILEHIGDGFGHVMKEMYRVCKHGAIIDIEVPHFNASSFWGDYTHRRPLTQETFRQFSKTHMDYHQETWKSSSGHAHTLDIDFEIIAFNYDPQDHWKERFRTMSPEEIEFASLSYNNVYSVIQIQLVTVKDYDNA